MTNKCQKKRSNKKMDINDVLDDIISEIIERYEDTEEGCYINGQWFSPSDLIALIMEHQE